MIGSQPDLADSKPERRPDKETKSNAMPVTKAFPRSCGVLSAM
jgi:hypothetical protein